MKNYINYLIRNNYSINTINTYSSILKSYLPIIDNYSLILKKIKSHFDSPNTAFLHYNVLISFFTFEKQKTFLNKLKKLNLPPIPQKYLNVFSKEFLYKKTEINNNDTNLIKKKKYTIRFLFQTGIRAHEINQIISFDDEILTVVGKGNKIREVFYDKETFENMWPFNKTTKTLRIWTKEILGNKYSPHSIRRSHATHMLLNGANPKTVMLQLGHSKIETTYKYLHLSFNRAKQEYKKYF